MTYQEFVNKYNGQYVDVDGYPKEWKYQCFDLVQLYNREVINVPDYVLAGCHVVKNLIYDPVERSQMDEFFDEVDTNAMNQGDVCVWGQGDAGHIAIFDSSDDHNLYFFSQNPNPSLIIPIEMEDLHAFRRKGTTPPLPEITPCVDRDERKNQIQVVIPNLNVRTQPFKASQSLGFATEGIYNYYEEAINDGIVWFRIADNQWIASGDEWTILYPAKEDEHIELKVLDKKDGYVLVDLGKVWIKE